MKSPIDHADLLKLAARKKGKCLSALEEIGCPSAYLDVIRKHYDYYRNDLIELARKGMPDQSKHTRPQHG